MSVKPIETWNRIGFDKDDLIVGGTYSQVPDIKIPESRAVLFETEVRAIANNEETDWKWTRKEGTYQTRIRLSTANKGALRVLGRTPILSLNLGERNLWLSFLVVESLDESNQFILGRDFIRIFDVTIDLSNAMFRIRNPERKYVIKPVNLIMANENQAPVFLSRRVRLKANKAAIVSLRMRNYNELSDNKQVCIVPNSNSQSAAILGRSFSITKSGLCVSVLLNTLGIPITIQRGRKLGYALPVKTRYEMTENVKENEVLDCPNYRDKICILRRLKKLKYSSGLVKSLKSETDDDLLSSSSFPERPTLEEL